MPDEAAQLAAVRESAASAGAFGVDLYRQLVRDDANTVFSPASVASALWMAWCGARGQTAAELARTLHLGESADVAADGLRALPDRKWSRDLRPTRSASRLGPPTPSISNFRPRRGRSASLWPMDTSPIPGAFK